MVTVEKRVYGLKKLNIFPYYILGTINHCLSSKKNKWEYIKKHLNSSIRCNRTANLNNNIFSFKRYANRVKSR